MPKLFVALLLLLCTPLITHAEAKSDICLVLAVDASDSTDTHGLRFESQLAGYAAAFRDKNVITSAIHAHARVTLMQWSGPGEQIAIPWVTLDSPRAVLAFADDIASLKRDFAGYTYLGQAITAATNLLLAESHACRRLVIDISSDGRSRNSAYPTTPPDTSVTEARNYAVASGVTINGLPILGSEYQITEYFRSEVIGGEDAFVVTVERADNFTDSLVRKLLRELLLS